MAGASYLVIVAKGDIPIYEAQLSAIASTHKNLTHYVLHSALDSVDQRVWTTTSMYLKDVDKFSEQQIISAFTTAGHIKFLLLHDPKLDENAIKHFFFDVYELYLKAALNPFYEKNTPITSRVFDDKIHALGKKL